MRCIRREKGGPSTGIGGIVVWAAVLKFFKMTNEQLEFNLNKGRSFGYNTESNADLVGWMILSKRFPIPRFFELFETFDKPDMYDQHTYQKQVKIRDEPYLIVIEKVTRQVFESDKRLGPEDQLLVESFTFSTLEEVSRFFKERGYELSEIKWTSDLEFL
jgi:hypothetical protein